MKTRIVILAILAVGLAAGGSPAANDQPKKSMMPMMMKPEGMMDMHLMMMERAWHMGATSMVLSRMMTEAGEALKGGNLPAAEQKALAGVLERLADLVPQLYYPGPLKPEQVQEIKKKMDELTAALEKIKAPK
jgi:hypothetical protein|uniref:Uncharacterized protein n=1 Tax=Desulfobacca acetoxidans TaxID=60893 RepID=A0A7C3UY70_9BACT